MFVLVTGGAGFIGSHVVDALLAAGHEVRIVDYLHPAAHDREPSYIADVEWLRDDLRAGADAAVAGVDAVLHQAAMVGLGVDLSDIAAYAAHNDLGTAELLRSLHARGFDGRIVLASSMVVYGEGRYACPTHGRQPAPQRAPADLDAGRFEPGCPVCGSAMEPQSVPEDAPADPRNVYAATKLHQEHLVNAYARETGAAAVALRYHNVYGPRMPRDTPYAGVASIFRSALEAGRGPRVFEDGRQMRDFVAVADVATANRLALEASPAIDGAFNIASGTPRSVGDLAAELARATGGQAPEVTGEFRLGDVRHVFASTKRARQLLGFAAAANFSEAVAEFAIAALRDPATST